MRVWQTRSHLRRDGGAEGERGAEWSDRDSQGQIAGGPGARVGERGLFYPKGEPVRLQAGSGRELMCRTRSRWSWWLLRNSNVEQLMTQHVHSRFMPEITGARRPDAGAWAFTAVLLGDGQWAGESSPGVGRHRDG